MNYNVRLQNFEKNDIINNTICNRNFPSNNLQMNFSPRPSMSKYASMPLMENHKPSNVPLKIAPNYHSTETFYPGTRKPPFCGFSSIIDHESLLRNQFFALQKGESHVYVPSSNSDLYENNIDFINNKNDLNKHLLFKEELFNDFNPNLSENIGNELFNNNTRVQLKNYKP